MKSQTEAQHKLTNPNPRKQNKIIQTITSKINLATLLRTTTQNTNYQNDKR